MATFKAKMKKKVAQKTTVKNLKDLTLDNDSMEKSAVPEEDIVLRLPPDRFYVKPQVRTIIREEKIIERAESYRVSGQITPITVHPVDENGNHLIEKGECRWRAWELIKANPENYPEIDPDSFLVIAVVDPEAALRTNKARIIGQFVENDSRDDLEIMDKAQTIFTLRNEEGMSNIEIAQAFGWVSRSKKPNRNKVGRYLAVMNLPPEGVKLVEDLLVSDLNTIECLQKIFEINESKFHAIVQYTRDKGGITRSYAEDEYNQCKLNIEEANSPASTQTPGSEDTAAGGASAEKLVTGNNSTVTITSKGDTSASQAPKSSSASKRNADIELRVEWNGLKSGVVIMDRKPEESGFILVLLDDGDEVSVEASELTIESLKY